MRRLTLPAFLLLALLALVPASASAADQVIQVAVGGNKSLTPANVTIAPDEKVTWTWASSNDHHIVSNAGTEESWDTGERTSGSHPLGGKTFVKSGAFGYHCVLHPQEMRGTVTVTGSPVPSFTKSASDVFAEDATSVSFNSTSSDPDGTVDAQAWDLDGDGAFDDSTDPAPTHPYTTPGTVNVGLRITDNRNNVRTTTQAITVRSRVPVAAFTGPASALTNANVTFNAGTSSDADGTISGYAWDLDNDGTYETDTAATP